MNPNINKVAIVDGTTGESAVLPTSPATTSTGTPSSVASSTSAVTLIASSSSATSRTIYNDSTSTLYVGEFATAAASVSLTTYTVQVAPGGFYTVSPEYSGQVQGIWATVNGNARVTVH
jgi:hypothetical protein